MYVFFSYKFVRTKNTHLFSANIIRGKYVSLSCQLGYGKDIKKRCLRMIKALVPRMWIIFCSLRLIFIPRQQSSVANIQLMIDSLINITNSIDTWICTNILVQTSYFNSIIGIHRHSFKNRQTISIRNLSPKIIYFCLLSK